MSKEEFIELNFVTYDIAEKLCEKGFKMPCATRYYRLVKDLSFLLVPIKDYNSDTYVSTVALGSKVEHWYYSAPTYPQVIEWFLNEHQIYISAQFDMQNSLKNYKGTITNIGSDITFIKGHYFDYKEAIRECILHALNSLKHE